MSARPSWSGHLRLSLVSCPVKLFPGTSSSDRVAFHTLSRKTHNRLRQQMFDPETGEVVDRPGQISGYEFEKGRYVLFEKDEIEALRIESTQTIDIERFVARSDIDELYWDTPYFMAPDGPLAQEAFAVIREAIRHKDVVGIGRVVLSSRERPVALQPRGKGMLVTRLRSAEEVRKPNEIFADIPDVDINEEMVSIAEQIIDRKFGPFDPAMFADRYQAALHDLVQAKLHGDKPVQPNVTEPGKVVNLFEALKKSLDETGGGSGRKAKAPSRGTHTSDKGKEPKRRRA